MSRPAFPHSPRALSLSVPEVHRGGFVEFRVNVGSIALTWNGQGQITGVDWSLQLFPRESEHKPPRHVKELMRKLRAYFDDGSPLGELDWRVIDVSQWTPFQSRVYEAIAKIPHGETRTYGWVASKVGQFAATRAVGQALRNNPLPIVVPCHRVVALDSIGGFMGIEDPSRPEMDLKRRLQQLETEFINPVFSFLTEGSRT